MGNLVTSVCLSAGCVLGEMMSVLGACPVYDHGVSELRLGEVPRTSKETIFISQSEWLHNFLEYTEYTVLCLVLHLNRVQVRRASARLVPSFRRSEHYDPIKWPNLESTLQPTNQPTNLYIGLGHRSTFLSYTACVRRHLEHYNRGCSPDLTSSIPSLRVPFADS